MHHEERIEGPRAKDTVTVPKSAESFFFLKHESTVASGKLLRLSQHLQWGCGGAVWSVAKTIGAQQLLFSIGVSVSESPIVLENGTTSAPGSLP